MKKPDMHVDVDMELPDCGVDLYGVLRVLEVNLSIKALTRTHGNIQQAANLLGLKRTALVAKIQRNGLDFWLADLKAAKAANPTINVEVPCVTSSV